MTDQRKQEIIKALAYGESAQQAAAAEGVTVAEVQQIAVDCDTEIFAEREMLRKAGYIDG